MITSALRSKTNMGKKNRTKRSRQSALETVAIQKTPQDIKQAAKNKNWRQYLFLTVILIITAVIYLPSLDNGFTNWDDNIYVTENNLVQQPANLHKMLTTPIGGNYHPLTIYSLKWDQQKAQQLDDADKARVFHATNLIVHLLNTALVFFFVMKLSKGRMLAASLTALFFGIHPMHVESVAWIAERKDVLYTFFFLISLLCYLQYREQRKLLWYPLCLVAFLLSVVSKPAAIVLPLSLLAIDYFQSRRWHWRMIIEKVPFFLVSLFFGYLTLNVQVIDRMITGNVHFGFVDKIVFASYALMMYVIKLVFPLHLSAIYPYPDLNQSLNPVFYLSIPFVLLAAFACYYARKHRYIVFGVLFFLINTILILQFVSVGQAIMADRYTYVAYIGLLLIPAWALDDWLKKPRRSMSNIIAAICISPFFVVFFIKLTSERIKVWKSSETLWQDAIDKYPHQIINAYVNLGHYYYRYGPYDKAMDNYKQAISIYPDIDIALVRIGNIYFNNRIYDSAIRYYDKTIKLNPRLVEAYTNRGSANARSGRLQEAVTDFTKALRLNPSETDALSNRGLAYYMLNQQELAIQDYNQLVAMNPKDHMAMNEIGESLLTEGRYKEAIVQFDAAIALSPDKGIYFANRSQAWKALGNKEKALSDARSALRLGTNISDSYLNELTH
jgi:Tfp pilus assembly protein PilF